jgi:hypothetical protein
MLDEDLHILVARISFKIKGNEALSPFLAPFGGIEIYQTIGTRQLKQFIHLVEIDLKAKGVDKVTVKEFPEGYHKSFSQIKNTFESLAYRSHKEIASLIKVDQESFDKKIKVSQRQKLKKAAQLFQFEKVNSDSAKIIYSFIAACRKERNQTLSMTAARLLKAMRENPDSFLFFRVGNNECTAAACIAICVNESVVYTLYYGHARKFDKVSPVVYLLSGIYSYAQTNNYSIIDLGTSMLNGKVNRPLLTFKSSIGGSSCAKLTFTKVLK